MSHHSEPEYDMGISSGLTSIVFFLAKVAAFLAFVWLPVLVFAAPYGDRKAGIPLHAQGETLVTRASQWSSALLWGVAVIPIAMGWFATLGAPTLAPVVYVAASTYGLYILGRRKAASDAIWLSPRAWFDGMKAAVTGPRSRWVAATLSGSMIVSLVLLLTGITDAAPLIVAVVTAQIVGAITSWRIGSRYADDVEWGQIQRERLGADVASILGVPLTALDATQFTERDGVVTVWPVPPAARLRTAEEIEARTAAVRPELTVAEFGPEALVLTIASHEVLDARERLAASGGLIGGMESVDSAIFPADTETVFDFSAGFDVDPLRKDLS